MWCSECQNEFPTVESAEVQVCPKCSFSAAHGNRPRRVPKLNPTSTKPKIRIDTAHQQPVERKSADDSELLSIASRWLGNRSLVHMAVFGLSVFLCGQAMLTWAFLTGHFVAWSIANFVSIVGVVIAVVTIILSLKRTERKLEHLARIVGRSEITRKKRKQVRKANGKARTRK